MLTNHTSTHDDGRCINYLALRRVKLDELKISFAGSNLKTVLTISVNLVHSVSYVLDTPND